MKLDDDLSHRESELGVVCERRKCTCQAMFIVHVHPIDHCNVPRLDIHGDRIFALCPACTKLFAKDMMEQLEWYRSTPPLGVSLTCKTCGRHVSKLHDVYQVESLVRL